MWFLLALGSSVFAALTSILAKIGIDGINSNLATAIRTFVVLIMSWGMVFLTNSQNGMFIPTQNYGDYQVILSSDDKQFGGFERIDTAYRYEATRTPHGWVGFNCYLPSRSAVVFKKVKN